MSRFPYRAAFLALSLSAACAAHAGDDETSYRFSGFGTAGYVATNTNDVTLVNSGQLKGARKHGSALVDSRVGGQLDVTFNATVSATVQAIAQQDAHGRFSPQLEWAFMRFKATDNLSLRLGRLGWPAYQVSDYRYVGYANPWVRAPLEVYSLAPLDYFEGADASWTHDLAGGYLTIKGLVGHASTAYPDTSDRAGRLKVNQLVGTYVTYEIGNLRVRGGLSTGKVTFDSSSTTALYNGLNLTGFGPVAQRLDADNTRTTFISLGANYDADNILLTGEYAKLRSDSLLGHANGWYGTFGYRLGKVMPYVTYAGYSKQDDSRDYPTVPAFGPLIPLANGVGGLVTGNSQHSTSLGMRWDVASSVAIKTQVEHVRPSDQGGTFAKVQPGYDGHAVNVYSAVVDFVF